MDIASEKVCFVIFKAREFDVKEAVVEEDVGSNPADESEREVLADYPDDPAYEELASFIDSLNEDEQASLVALAWIGREDFATDEWDDAVATAKERHSGSTAQYLLGIPLIGDYLEEGLTQLGFSCEEYEIGRL